MLNEGRDSVSRGQPTGISDEGSSGIVEESILVFRRLPGVVLQWRWKPRDHAGEPMRLHLAVDWRLPAHAVPELPGSTSDPLTFRLPDDDAAIRVHARGPTVGWHDGSGERSHRVGLAADLEPDAPLTLLFVLDSGGRIGASATLRRLASLDDELEARASDDRRAGETELDLDVHEPGNASVTDAFRWARRRLHGALVHPGGRRPGALRTGPSDLEDRPTRASPGEVARIGMGLLALGRHEDAEELVDRVLERLGKDSPASQAPRGAASSRGVAGLMEFLGRYTLWTGDAGPLDRLGDRLEAWLEALTSRAPGPSGRSRHGAAVRAALSDCAEAVEASGDRERADVLRTLQGEVAPDAPGGGAVSLEGGSVEWIRRIEERLRIDGAGSPDLSALAETGRLVAWLLFELLGGRADGFYGRLRLAPRIPRQWHRFVVGGIRMADARLRFSYHDERGRHTFRLEPTSGRVPVNLVFEPLLPVAALGRAWVDGAPAEVDRYRRDGRIGIRLQLPLDDTREVVLEAG